nr:MAG TPA_asm: hypothetical protein [Caudoviricetes sp.]
MFNLVHFKISFQIFLKEVSICIIIFTEGNF